MCISPDGRLVAAGSLDFIVYIWDFQSGQLLSQLKAHRGSVYSVVFTPDGYGLISGSLDNAIKYWDVRQLGRSATFLPSRSLRGVESGEQQVDVDIDDGENPPAKSLPSHGDYVLTVAVSHDGRWVVSGSRNREARFCDLNTATTQCVLKGHRNSGMYYYQHGDHYVLYQGQASSLRWAAVAPTIWAASTNLKHVADMCSPSYSDLSRPEPR